MIHVCVQNVNRHHHDDYDYAHDDYDEHYDYDCDHALQILLIMRKFLLHSSHHRMP
jgi:hypothetical protein